VDRLDRLWIGGRPPFPGERRLRGLLRASPGLNRPFYPARARMLALLIPEADELGRLGVPTFMFQEGHDQQVEYVFRNIALTTHGAYCRFNPGAARQLGEPLRAVAVFAAGGMTALAARKDAAAVKLLGQMR
jgi:hypothetical protein